MIFLLINLIGALFIGLIVWWFWFSESKTYATTIQNFSEIKVRDGVYNPSHIEVPVNQPVTLRFIREDASPCAEYVIFSTLNISQQLPLGKPTDLVFTIKTPGEYEFTCQMGMYRGKLIARE